VLRERFTELFKTKTRAEWCDLLEGGDSCFAPVLTMSEAAEHPHIRARNTVVEHDGILQPAPAPRFSRTKAEIRRGAPKPGEHTDEVLGEWGFSGKEIAQLRASAAIR
jgi:alpha-methylacyl-CoA racemase